MANEHDKLNFWYRKTKYEVLDQIDLEEEGEQYLIYMPDRKELEVALLYKVQKIKANDDKTKFYEKTEVLIDTSINLSESDDNIDKQLEIAKKIFRAVRIRNY